MVEVTNSIDWCHGNHYDRNRLKSPEAFAGLIERFFGPALARRTRMNGSKLLQAWRRLAVCYVVVICLGIVSSGMAQIQSATNTPTPSDYVCVNQGPKGVNE
jgi:hypothetical protein